jgi:hypothetical protein
MQLIRKDFNTISPKRRNSNNKRQFNKQHNKNLRTYDESANAANQRKIICYTCGKEGRIAPDCKAPKKDRKQQANASQEKTRK